MVTKVPDCHIGLAPLYLICVSPLENGGCWPCARLHLFRGGFDAGLSLCHPIRAVAAALLLAVTDPCPASLGRCRSLGARFASISYTNVELQTTAPAVPVRPTSGPDGPRPTSCDITASVLAVGVASALDSSRAHQLCAVGASEACTVTCSTPSPMACRL